MFTATVGYGGQKSYGAGASYDQPQNSYYGAQTPSYGRQSTGDAVDNNQNGARPVSMNFSNLNTSADTQQRPKSQLFGNQANTGPIAAASSTHAVNTDADFESIRADCLRNRTLFEDQAFPANSSSLLATGEPRMRIVWLRPPEICSRYFRNAQPTFMQLGRFDARLGVFGDRWLLSAVSSLVDYPDLLRVLCQPGSNQSRLPSFAPGDYAGIFRFRFWRFGEWRTVIVDDRLPCNADNGEPLTLHSSSGTDWTVALLEKAYAKLCGSFEALKFGMVSDCLTDFTGGLVEPFELESFFGNTNSRAVGSTRPASVDGLDATRLGELNNVLFKAFERQSLVGATTRSRFPEADGEQQNGLASGHSYTVTDIKEIRLIHNQTAAPNQSSSVTLVRVRNPFNYARAAWRGAWSTASTQWNSLTPSDRDKMGLVVEDDGEFWIDLADFVRNFQLLFICHLPTAYTPPAPDTQPVPLWYVSEFNSEWIRHVSAGGSPRFRESHFLNPQFRITLSQADYDEYTQTVSNEATFLVELTQTDSRALHHKGARFAHIGFTIYPLDAATAAQLPAARRFFEERASVAQTDSHVNTRSVVHRCVLPLGEYLLVPSTHQPGNAAEFMVRCFFEQANSAHNVVERCELPDSVAKLLPERDSELNTREAALRRAVYELSDEDMQLDAFELNTLLNRELAKQSNEEVSVDTCKLLVATGTMMSGAASGVGAADRARPKRMRISYTQFLLVWNHVRSWKKVFQSHDKDRSGRISAFELKQALSALQFKVDTRLLNRLVFRFAPIDGMLSFDQFAQCVLKLIGGIILYLSHDGTTTRRISQEELQDSLEGFVVL